MQGLNPPSQLLLWFCSQLSWVPTSVVLINKFAPISWDSYCQFIKIFLRIQIRKKNIIKYLTICNFGCCLSLSNLKPQEILCKDDTRIYRLSTKHEVNKTGYWPHLFLVCIWTKMLLRSINLQKNHLWYSDISYINMFSLRFYPCLIN